MKKIVQKLLFFMLCLASAFSFSQEVLSFQDCLNRAFSKNLLLQSSVVDQKIADTQYKKSFAKLLPTINGDISSNTSIGRGIDPDTNTFFNDKYTSYSGEIRSRLVLFDGLLNITNIKLAKQEVELNKANWEKTKNDITIEIATKFTNILYLEEIIKAIGEQIKVTEKQIELVQTKFKEGYIAESEVYKIKSQKSTEELNLINTQSLLNLNYIDLKQLLNIPVDKEITLKVPRQELFAEVKYSYSKEFLEKALKQSPDYTISKINEMKAKTNIAIARAPLLPTVSTGFDVGTSFYNPNSLYNNSEQINNNVSYNFSVNVSIPIFNQLQDVYKLKESKLLFNKTQIGKQIEKNKVSKVVLQAINDANVAYKKYDSSLSAFQFAEKSFVADQLKFQYGKISANELHITKNSFVSAQSDLIKSKYELLFSQALIQFYENNIFILD